MAYYLTIENKRGTYQPLNITKSKYFQTIPKFNKPCAYELREIDLFTTLFNNEEELRNALVEELIIKPNQYELPLSIRCLTKGKYNKVPYDFLYQKDIEYIFDPTKLIETIIKRYHNNDFLFIKKFANYFSDYYVCKSTAPEVRQLAEISLRDGIRNHHLDEVDKNGDNQITRLIKLLILDHYELENGYIVYKNKINYRNLHTIIAFINNYDKKIKQQKEIEYTETIESSDNNPNNETNNKQEEKQIEKVKTRTLGKKKYHLDNQMSFEI